MGLWQTETETITKRPKPKPIYWIIENVDSFTMQSNLILKYSFLHLMIEGWNGKHKSNSNSKAFPLPQPKFIYWIPFECEKVSIHFKRKDNYWHLMWLVLCLCAGVLPSKSQYLISFPRIHFNQSNWILF